MHGNMTEMEPIAERLLVKMIEPAWELPHENVAYHLR